LRRHFITQRLTTIQVTITQMLNKSFHSRTFRVNNSHWNDKEYSYAVFYTQDVPWQRTFSEGYPVSGVTSLLQHAATSRTNAMQSWIISQGIKGKMSQFLIDPLR
jgi:hypothetical protein